MISASRKSWKDDMIIEYTTQFYATIQCQECGWICDPINTPSAIPPSVCPDCGSDDFKVIVGQFKVKKTKILFLTLNEKVVGFIPRKGGKL